MGKKRGALFTTNEYILSEDDDDDGDYDDYKDREQSVSNLATSSATFCESIESTSPEVTQEETFKVNDDDGWW